MAEADTPRNDRLTLVIILVTAGLAVALAIVLRALLSVGPASGADSGRAGAPTAHAEGALQATSGRADSGLPAGTTGAVRILDSADLGALVGRQVEIEVGAAAVANDIAFWEGGLLVVVGPDVRAWIAEHRGTVRLKGVIEPLPPREAMTSWALTASDLAQLIRCGVYVRAVDAVLPGRRPLSTSDPAPLGPAN